MARAAKVTVQRKMHAMLVQRPGCGAGIPASGSLLSTAGSLLAAVTF